MTMPPPLTDRRYSNKMSAEKKVLLGCGIGCGTITILVLIAIGFGVWWLFSPEVQVPTNRILNAGSSAAFRLEDISRNQDVMRLISDISRETQRIKQNNMPDLPVYLQKFKKYFESQQDPAKFIELFVPKEATASVSIDEKGNAVFVIAANFGKGTRIVKIFLNTVFEKNEDLKDNKISTRYGDLFLFDRRNDWNGDKSRQNILGFYKGTIIFGNDYKSALSALDRLADGNNTGKLNEALSDPFYRLGRNGCLAYGVLDGALLKNPEYRIGLFKGELGTEMKKAGISLDSLSSEKGIVNLHIEWNNKDFAVKADEEIEKLKPEWINKARQNGFDMEIMNSLKDEQTDIRFSVNNLKDSLIHLIQKNN